MGEMISKEAKAMYDEHKRLAVEQHVSEYVEHVNGKYLAQAKIDKIEGRKPRHYISQVEADIAGHKSNTERAAEAVKSQAEAAEQFVSKHLNQFVDQAVEDATAEGVELNDWDQK
ncbi:MAG TPA: hypothetical protein VLG13_02610 [Patescibacteria group bacterium]|nr:hypothetical protein [Patescibacteria group bacterium]